MFDRALVHSILLQIDEAIERIRARTGFDGQSLQRLLALENVQNSPNEAAGDYRQRSGRRNYLPLPKDKEQAHT
jgi:hypothetical protein